MTTAEFIEELKKRTSNKDIVFYSNETRLMNYDFIGVYENEGQVEIHFKEGEKLEK